jgi:hypothetical protein
MIVYLLISSLLFHSNFVCVCPYTRTKNSPLAILLSKGTFLQTFSLIVYFNIVLIYPSLHKLAECAGCFPHLSYRSSPCKLLTVLENLCKVFIKLYKLQEKVQF